MSKAYLLVICLLSASFTGCLGGEDDDEIIIDPIVSKPTATIVSINPNPANLTSLENNGVTIIRKPGPMKHGTTVIAFIQDPDGYSIELIER